jgi:hypothetical protein
VRQIARFNVAGPHAHKAGFRPGQSYFALGGAEDPYIESPI